MLCVGELMTRDPVVLHDSDTLATARTTMERRRIRHLPVVGPDGRFVGLLTHRDLLSFTISQLADIDDTAQDEIDASIMVGTVMRQGVMAAEPGTPVREAAQIMLDNKFGCLPVVDKGKVVGILTEADFIKLTIGLMDELARIRNG
ncbi:putative signal transduction protein with CBS domain containing protein [Desulfovibrio sp. X2]|uniref:CBS domain-containing protein n=1 Tax=Desulfovibrio sp. X2 TaxID=941449 RepID=UPI00035871E0|nr:CBS domain-containing protein [Desulfovibrio sp. X2]EPR42218.1 putative signal transduction protein with CBS domain containing protein [Desulfovibrio sp. X2]